MIILGGLGDQITTLVWGTVSKPFFSFLNSGFAEFPQYEKLFWDFLHPLQSNQPLTWFLYSVLISILGAGGYNLILLINLLLSFVCALVLFRKYRFSFVYAAIFTFSGYMWSHLGLHPDLIQLWPIPLYLYFLLEKQNMSDLKKSIVLAMLASLTLALSNYYGYFLLITTVFYAVICLFTLLLQKNKLSLNQVRNALIWVGIVLVLSSTFLYPYISANYLTKTEKVTLNTRLALDRPYADFFTFSSRPWYFFIPSPNNPVYGNLSENVLTKLKDTNYFLADDYFTAEHGANFFGFMFLTSVLLSSVFMFIKTKGDARVKIAQLFILLFFLFLYMLPPFFTLSGIKIYTPGHLAFTYFPMFRVTARISIIILPILLLILATNINYIWLHFERWRKSLKVAMVAMLLVTLIEVFSMPPLPSAPSVPEVYTFLNKHSDTRATFFVYPYSKTQEALYFLSEHERFLLNPRDYNSAQVASEHITLRFASDGGYEDVLKLNPDYIVVFKNISPKEKAKILSSKEFELEQEFSDAYLLKVVE